jgi:predicted permease
MEREVREELAFHLEMLEREHRNKGMPEPMARQEALDRFGDPRRAQKRALEVKRAHRRRKQRRDSMDDLIQDVRYATRGLLTSRSFAVVVLLTLSVGIGATTAMYSVLRTALGRALPFPEPDRLVLGEATINGNPNPMVAFPDYLDYRDQSESFETLGAMTGFATPVTVTGTDEPERVPMALATGNLFEALGVTPHLGRTFSAQESQPGGPPSLLLSYGFWQRRFGGSADVVGRTVNLNGSPVPVVGVMPADFHLILDAEAWIPAADGGPFTGVRRFHNWLLVGRLKDGVSIPQAQAEMDVISAQLQEEYPESNEAKALQLAGLHDWLVDDYRTSLFLLMGAISLVLLIACGNVASLLMARGSARTTEMAVRTALGADRGRLVRQLLTESILLALAAGLLGVMVALWMQDLIPGFISLDLLGIQDIEADLSILGFALGLSLVTALLFGTVPALAAARPQPARDLKEGGRGTTSGGAGFRSFLVVLQVAVSVVLLVGSALLLRSFGRLTSVDPGFDAHGLLAAEVSLPPAAYQDPGSRLQFFRDLRESIEALPGVQSVGMVDRLPIRNPGNNIGIWSPERPPTSSRNTNHAYQRIVVPGYFETMGVPVLAGRDFDTSDRPGSPPVIILNQTAADTVFLEENPLGRQVAVDVGGDAPALFEVVGVVGDQHLSSLGSRVRLAMFFPYEQRPAFTMQLAVRTESDPSALIRPIQERLWSLDREIPLSDPESMTEALASSVSGTRAVTTMLGMFSGVALFLAALGLYGVLAYFVARRVHEIGIRVAIGASAGRVVKLILGRGMALVTAGLVLGLVGALGATRLLEDFLFETAATDPGTFAGVALFFALVALAACALPAWRALRVDPVVAFRAE